MLEIIIKGGQGEGKTTLTKHLVSYYANKGFAIISHKANVGAKLQHPTTHQSIKITEVQTNWTDKLELRDGVALHSIGNVILFLENSPRLLGKTDPNEICCIFYSEYRMRIPVSIILYAQGAIAEKGEKNATR